MKKSIKRMILCASLLVIILIGLVISILFLKNSNLVKKEDYYTFESRIDLTNTYKIADAETVGWIQVQGTNIDYPVISETNNAYATGIDYVWRTNSYKEGENRTAIYGHNILNVSSNPIINGEEHTRFEQLMGFVYEDFAKENLYIQYTHDGKDDIYKIYAVTFLYSDDDIGESYRDKDELKKYINNVKDASIYDYDVDVDSSDELISLITCTRYFGRFGKTQFKVDARKLRKNENIEKYSVYINENYDIIKENREVK